ncbi:NADPH:quinone reductase [Phaeobacter sp.]|uniref:NADPH:quinone reductase n=1 Tax=Phaeobacter sp. TaxID=1902409 RepID=UPI0025E8941E|nr:NADPH:quinone reductase [Phaeobacter sp.]
MKAAFYRRFGAADAVMEVGDLDDQPPAAGEVTVALAYSGVNPSDVKARAGARAGVTDLPFPTIVPHSDGSGVIVAVGPGVDSARIGQSVWIWNGQWKRAFGTAADQITLPAQQAVPMVAEATLEQGAVLGIPGLTAAHTVFQGGDVAGKTVLVQGGAGMVGRLAVQMAKWGGARVIATCSASDVSYVTDAGADVVLEYAQADLSDAILAANDGKAVEHIVEVEFGANCQIDADVIAENGRIVAYGSAKAMTPTLPFYPLMFKNVSLEMALVYLLPQRIRDEAIHRLNGALQDHALHIPVAETFDLTQIAAAHEAVETGQRRGAILVKTQ